jgi:hypothetical protein
MSTTVSSGSTASFGMDAFASLAVVPSANDARGTITFTSAAPNSDRPSFTANLQAKTFGPFLVPMSVSIAVEDGSCTYQLTGSAGGFGYDSSGNVTGLVGPDSRSINFDRTYRPLTAVATWVGDGGASRTISGVGFRPDLVIAKPEAAGAAWFWHKLCWRSLSPRMGEASAHASLALDFTDDGLIVGSGANASGVVYHALFVADNGSGKLAVGSYAGNGVDDREIDVGLAPVFVALKRDNTYPCWTRATGMTTSYPLTGAASASNIKSLTSAGFTVGTAADVNAASNAAGSGGEAYDYFALAASDAWRVMQFVGSGAARDLSVINSPAFALIKSHDSGTPRDAQVCFSTMASGSSADINGAVETGAMGVGSGISLGANAVTNGSTITNTILAVQASVSGAESAVRPTLPAVRIGADGGMIAPTRNTDFALNGVALSLEVAFVYRDTAPAQPITLLSVNENNTNAGHHFGIQLSTANRSLQFQCLETGPVTRTLEYGFVPKNGEVVHVGFSFDGTSEVLISINGKLRKRASSALTIVATGTPANAKVTVGNRRSGSDSVATTFDSTDCSFMLWRIYGAALTAAQWSARYRRAILRDHAAADVVPLEEWDAANVVGSTLYASLKSANNMTLINCTTETV